FARRAAVSASAKAAGQLPRESVFTFNTWLAGRNTARLATQNSGVFCYAYDRHREVVQRHQGLWLHHPRERREGLLRASLRHSGPWLQVLGGRREGGVRRGSGRQGPSR